MLPAIEFDQIGAYLAGVAQKLEREPMPEAMENARQAMHAGHEQNFASQSTRTGSPWAPRKQPTGGWPILTHFGPLRAAATGQGPGAVQETDGRTATVGVDTGVRVTPGGVHSAGFHQSGTSRMPARPWLGASDEIENAIGEHIADAGLKFF